MSTQQPSGRLQVKPDKQGRSRSFYAYWRDCQGEKHGRRLGPAHVKDSGRRSSRGAVVWRAGDGPRPSPEHLTPRDAAQLLEDILDAARAERSAATILRREGTLRQAIEGWIAERQAKRGLRRSTIAGYEDMFGRICRDLGGDMPVRELEDGRLVAYFENFPAERALGKKKAAAARAEGREVVQLEVENWTAQPPGSQAVEVATQLEAVRLADELEGTWKHRRKGAYRVVPSGAQRARRVSWMAAQTLQSDGWLVARRVSKRYVVRCPAAPQTINKYRDILGAALDYAIRQGWLEENPIAAVDRASMRAVRRRILRRDDFYNPDEVNRLLQQAASVFEEAFWLCGAHAGLRLPGEALGLRWGAVDFDAGVIRPYDNWVLNQADVTKTSEFAPIPMTPRLSRALARLKERDFATGDDEHVFASDRHGRPVSEKTIRDAFKQAVVDAGLRPIPMYNLRHSFGTTLASRRVDLRTIQALMRHDRLSTTEQYIAYAPQPELARQIALALDPPSVEAAAPHANAGGMPEALLRRLEEEIPARWLREVQRAYEESPTAYGA